MARPSDREKLRGTTWCRYGVRTPTAGFAVRIENRYKGIRAPHKLKGGVSGCVRECAEAQGKDFGLIATEKGWNVFVCGNGGATAAACGPARSDVDEDTASAFDRFLDVLHPDGRPPDANFQMIRPWKVGIEYLRDVIINDRLQIADELERQAQFLVESYRCEWREVVKDPQRAHVPPVCQ